MRYRLFKIAVAMLVIAFFGYEAFRWTVCRIYVQPGQSAVVTYKGPLLFGSHKNAKPGYWAEAGEVGIQKQLLGPGRHFLNPVWYSVEYTPNIEILPGQVGIVRCKLGADLPAGEYLVDGDIGETTFKGTLRKVLVTGEYRINPYGYDVEVVDKVVFNSGGTDKVAGWVDIPTGYVGVVTNLAANQARGITTGISDQVLQPGIYLINPREQQIDVVKIGYRETTIQVKTVVSADGTLQRDSNGEPTIDKDDSGIQFPSADGYKIHLDFTTIWGLLPEQAPHAIRSFGNMDAVEQKIITPQIDSVLRNKGSAYKAVQLLVGSDREKYQTDAVDELIAVLKGKQLSVLKGLVRHVYIPEDVRKPIQEAYIADELKLTREEEQNTTKEEGVLREAEQRVELAGKTVDAETEKLVAMKIAEGDREAEGIKAATIQKVAAIAKETARFDADAKRVLGQATSEGKKLKEQATADRFRLAVEAFGTAGAYNRWIFASGLPDSIDLELIYAGEGTLWTNSGADFGIRANLPIGRNPILSQPATAVKATEGSAKE